MSLRRNEYPGKFEGGLVIDEIAYQASLEAGDTISLSDNEVDAYTILNGPFTDTYGIAVTQDEKDYLLKVAGCIVHEDNYGFVTVDWCDTEDELSGKWHAIEALEEEIFDEGEENE